MSLSLFKTVIPPTDNSLFLLTPIPPTVSAFANRLELCQVPDIPATDVFIVSETNSVTGTNYFYCRVETRRGVFRSRSIIILPGAWVINSDSEYHKLVVSNLQYYSYSSQLSV